MGLVPHNRPDASCIVWNNAKQFIFNHFSLPVIFGNIESIYIKKIILVTLGSCRWS